MRVTLALPLYQGAGGLTIRSLLTLQAALLARGDEVRVDIEAGGSIIPKVRNRLAKRFLESGDDYMVFIDADMVFDADDILGMLDSETDVCALNYTWKKKELTWANKPVLETGEVDALKVRGRIFIKTALAGTGLMMISRNAMSKVTESCSDEVYEDQGEQTVAVFNFTLHAGQFVGEDYLFCLRWLDLGGEIWTLADATTGHVGETVYLGNYCEHLRGKS